MNKLWPSGARVDENGELWLGGCAASALARTYGTPLYVFDERTLRERARAYQAALKQHYPGSSQIAYASKAYLSLAIAQLFDEEGLDLDVVSGGELSVALAAGFPPERIHFHGNNKSAAELALALNARPSTAPRADAHAARAATAHENGTRMDAEAADDADILGFCLRSPRRPRSPRPIFRAGVGRIVVDNFRELDLLAELTAATRNSAKPPLGTQHASRITPIWLRLSPGVEAHTHAHIQTGHLDTKFGFPIATGAAEAAVARVLQTPGLTLVGLHCNIGSQIYETESLAEAAARLAEFAAQMRDRYGFVLRELSPGGGWGVPMTDDDPDAPIEQYVAVLAGAVVAACRAHGLELPHLVLEPGRSLIAPAAVTLYTVGARKEIAGVRTYVSVDGGMADNIRPALYGAKYTALQIADCGFGSPQSAIRNPQSEIVTIAGRFCESGDVLIRDIELPRLEAGDLLAIPMAGAYTLSMASNYNLTPRPAVVLVNDGHARLMQRRETYADLMTRDLPLHGAQHALRSTHHAARTTQHAARFWKYQALGNDYIVLDPADWPEPPTGEQIRRICDRHRGVGADGILWGPIPPTAPPAPQRWGESGSPQDWGARGASPALRLFNPDGGEFEKSGNGLRIFARYLWDRGYVSAPDFTIGTPGGPVIAHVLEPTGAHIAMDMGTLSFDSAVIPVAGPPREVVEEEIIVAGRSLRITAVTIGNPHCVVFVDDQTFEVSKDPSFHSGQALEGLARTLGPQLEQLPLYPNRTNVQFAQALDPHRLRIEIWERGAGYTLASGTSSCAAAGAAIRTGRCASPVTVQMPGGEMLVEVAEDWSVRLTGTVGVVCQGEVSEDVMA
ncbi:MAG: diaminopimelate decarboxylase [Chloroflexi bacterium]|nr:diaminopimelate decarboxylase [Chloroflexota bacterium]